MKNLAKVVRSNLATLIATSLLIPSAALAATLPVGPGQTYTTIQSAIAAAAPGDIVLVAPGTYYENLDFLGKAITVTSASGPATTIIDGQYKGPAVQFNHGETRASVLSNLTIRNGGNFESVTNGQSIYAAGGIYLYGSAPTILNNIITGNRCWSLDIEASAPLVQGNNISATLDPLGECGFGSGTAVIVGDDMLGPSGKYDQPALILGNTIEKNVESGMAPGAIAGGAAIAVWGGSPLIENNILRNNASPGGVGGAILLQTGSGITVVQNLIYGNSAGCGGGGLAINSGFPGALFDALVANNTIVNNDDSKTGHATNCDLISQFYPSPDSYGASDPGVVFVNNIFSGAAIYPAVDCTHFDTPSESLQPLFDHNLFFNASGTIFGSTCIDVSRKYGNIVADPQFVDPQTNNYRLKPGSPAVDTGLASVLQSIKDLSGTVLSTDLDTNPRVQDATGKGTPTIDMGAYELAGALDGTPTLVVLTSSAYNGPPGSPYTFTATLSSTLGVPTGAVTLYLDGQAVSSTTVTGAGTATWPSITLTPGFHALYAIYGGQAIFPTATSVNIAVVVYAYDTSLKIFSSANPSILGQPVTFTVTSSSTNPSYSPTPVTLTDTTTGTLLTTLTFGTSSTATYTTSTLTLGSHTIQATYAGTTAYLPASTSLVQTVNAGKPTGTTLASSQNPSAAGQSITLTAQVHATNPPDGIPVGTVLFSDSGQALATVNLDSTGTAIFAISTLTPGSHSITATYLPTSGFSASSAQLLQQISTTPSSALLTATPASVAYGDTLNLTVQVSSSASSKTPTGTVIFTDGSKQLGTSTLTSGAATLSLSTLSPGPHTLSCTYSGDSTYAATSCNVVTVTVSAAPSTLKLSSVQNPSYALATTSYTAQLTVSGHPAGPGYTITLASLPLGSTISAITDTAGSATFIETFSAGSYALTASVAGSPVIQPASATLTQQVQPNPTAITFSSSSTAAAQGQVIALSTGVTSLATATSPVGTITIFDGTASLGTVTLSKSSGNSSSATLTTSSLSVGAHTLSAVYTPASADFVAGSSDTISETIAVSDFSIHVNAGTVSVQTGHHTTFPITVTSVGAFAGAVTLSCGTSSDATYVNCDLPSSVQLTANGSTTLQVSIETDQIPGFLASNTTQPGISAAIGGKLLAFGVLPLLFYRKRKRLPSLIVAMLVLVTMGISGCTGKYPGHTPPGTYTVFVQGVGGASEQHTASLSLVVTP